jgi:uncharacterized protein (DUF433 family)
MIDWRKHLTSDPKICGGQLCAKGTRVLVTVILDNLAEGLSREDILRSYPTLKPMHIDAAMAYAAELARASCPSSRREVQARRESPHRVAGRSSHGRP